MSETKKKCFIVSPIGLEGSQERKHADLVLNYIIKPIVETNFGYEALRGDHVGHSGMITVGIINALLDSDLVIADLSFLNPNVFYELGLRHSTRKPTIHLASHDTKLPFDNADHRTIFYDLGDWNSHQVAKTLLTEHIAAMQNAEGVTNPVTLAHAHKNANNFAETLSAVNSYLEKLEARIEEISTVPPEGRVTRAYFSEVSERHKTEISAIVDSIRKRIDLRNSEQNPAPSTQIAAVLGRLDRIEIFIGSLNPATVSPSTSTAH